MLHPVNIDNLIYVHLSTDQLHFACDMLWNISLVEDYYAYLPICVNLATAEYSFILCAVKNCFPFCVFGKSKR